MKTALLYLCIYLIQKLNFLGFCMFSYFIYFLLENMDEKVLLYCVLLYYLPLTAFVALLCSYVTERAGKSMAEIFAYEAIQSREVPALTFLREWILTGTVQQFLDILDDIERPDVHELILNHLKERARQP